MDKDKGWQDVLHRVKLNGTSSRVEMHKIRQNASVHEAQDYPDSSAGLSVSVQCDEDKRDATPSDQASKKL